MSALPESVRNFILDHKKFLVLGHLEPDGDSTASQIVLASFLRRMGKRALLFCEGPFDRPEIQEYEPLFKDRLGARDLSGEPAVAVLDCSTTGRMGALAAQVRGRPTLVIDHHSSGREFGDVRWLEPRAPATVFLIQQLMEALEYPPTREEAELLLFGLCTDTGFFRHLGPDSAPVFASVSRLVEAGASPERTFRQVYGGQELAKMKLLSQALSRVEEHFGGRLLLSCQYLEDFEGKKSNTRGSYELYNLLQTVKGVEVIAFVREESRGQWSVGLRSGGTVDVGSLASALGGGGHRMAAGFNYRGTCEEIKGLLLEHLGKSLKSRS